MKPKHLVYCPDCGYKKQLFDSESKAYRFLKYNGEEIFKQNGKVPTRAYFCIACAGWHLTSKRKRDCLSNSEKAIQNLENYNYMRKYHKPRPSKQQCSIDTIEECIASSRNFCRTGEFDKALQLINKTWKAFVNFDFTKHEFEKDCMEREIKNVGKSLKNAGFNSSDFAFNLEELIAKEKENDVQLGKNPTAKQIKVKDEMDAFFAFRIEFRSLFDQGAYDACEKCIKNIEEDIIPKKDIEISLMPENKLKRKYARKMADIKLGIQKLNKKIPYHQALIIYDEIEDAIENIHDNDSYQKCEELYMQLKQRTDQMEELKKNCLKPSFIDLCDEVNFLQKKARKELDQVHHHLNDAKEKASSIIENEHNVKQLFQQKNFSQVLDILINDGPIIIQLKFNKFVDTPIRDKIESIEDNYTRLIGILKTQLSA